MICQAVYVTTFVNLDNTTKNLVVNLTMLSAVFFMNLKGEVVISRIYRDDIP